ncbi:MAG: biotin/lipoyl-binding protein, partial [Rhizobiaceae bacterium]|nr:biotin/lipoyl-binding protein [Rhizobiaceae bacterium]
MFVREIHVDGAVPAEASPGSPQADAPRTPEHAQPPRRLRRLTLWVLGLAVLGGAALLATNRLESTAPAAQTAAAGADVPAIPVNTALARLSDVAIYRTGLGSVQAFNTVSVTSRVEGQLESIAFEEGQDVKAGAVLATIDDRAFQAAVRAKEAQLRSARARTQTVKADLERMSKLLKADVGSRQTYETQLALLEQSEAEADAA